MKKIFPFVAVFVFIACNSRTPTVLPAVVDGADNRDSVAMATSDSLSVQTVTEVAETSKELRPPPPPGFVKPEQKGTKQKSAAKSKAKIDSIAIREANKLPLDQ